MKLISRLFKWGTYLLLSSLLLSYLSPYISSDYCWPLMFFGMAFPWLYFANFLLSVFWMLFDRRLGFILFIPVILGLGYIETIYGFNKKENTEQSNFKLISYNVNSLYGAKLKSPFWKTKTNPILDFVKQEDPNLWMAQELHFGPHKREIFKYYDLYDFEYTENTLFYQASTKPFIEKGFIAKNDLNGISWFDLPANGKIIRCFNVHLKSNKISLQTNQFDFKKDLFSKKVFSYLKLVLKNIVHYSKIRNRQAEVLAKHISKSPYPVIVCGDFNEVPLSYPYRIISKGLKDAFYEKGRGFGFTYLGKIPGLRLDYVLVGPEIEIVDLRIGKDKLSDHYPLIAYLKIK